MSPPDLPGQIMQHLSKSSKAKSNSPAVASEEPCPIPFNPIKPIAERPKTMNQNGRKHKRMTAGSGGSSHVDDLSIEDSTSPDPHRHKPSVAEFIPSPTPVHYIPEIKNKKAILPPLRTPNSIKEETSS